MPRSQRKTKLVGTSKKAQEPPKGSEQNAEPGNIASAAALAAVVLATHLSSPGDASSSKKKAVSQHSLKNLQILVESERTSAKAGARPTQHKYWYYRAFPESTYVRAYFLSQKDKPSPGSAEDAAVARFIQDMFERIKDSA